MGTAPTCVICKASGESALEMLEKCTNKQKLRIIGQHRSFSCDMCDVHLSEQSWLDNHNGGEKHRWVVDRVEKLLPVKFHEVDMLVVNKNRFDPYTGVPSFWQEFRCVVCKVGFSPIDRYKKHIGSLFHLRRCAGEDVKWVDSGNGWDSSSGNNLITSAVSVVVVTTVRINKIEHVINIIRTHLSPLINLSYTLYKIIFVLELTKYCLLSVNGL